jgi:hypothetical protein
VLSGRGIWRIRSGQVETSVRVDAEQRGAAVIIFMRGTPRAGKTTRAQELRADARRRRPARRDPVP